MRNGFSLFEMMVVLAVIGIIAAIAVPSANTTEHQQLELAAATVADSLRYAREESRRTGQSHGILVDLPNNQIRVFRLNEGPDPNLRVFDQYHPITKQRYFVQLAASPFANTTLNAIGGTMVGTCSESDSVAFDPSGVVRCIEPVATRVSNASIELAVGELRSTVSVDDYTGRVTIQ